jgi:hypothetical protein
MSPFKVNQYAYWMASTIENAITGSVLASPGVRVLKLESNRYARVAGPVCEPGAGSTFDNIDSGCVDVHLLGVVNNTSSLGTDDEIGTVKMLNNGMHVDWNLVIAGGTPNTKHLAASAVLVSRALPRGVPNCDGNGRGGR